MSFKIFRAKYRKIRTLKKIYFFSFIVGFPLFQVNRKKGFSYRTNVIPLEFFGGGFSSDTKILRKFLWKYGIMNYYVVNGFNINVN